MRNLEATRSSQVWDGLWALESSKSWIRIRMYWAMWTDWVPGWCKIGHILQFWFKNKQIKEVAAAYQPSWNLMAQLLYGLNRRQEWTIYLSTSPLWDTKGPWMLQFYCWKKGCSQQLHDLGGSVFLQSMDWRSMPPNGQENRATAACRPAYAKERMSRIKSKGTRLTHPSS